MNSPARLRRFLKPLLVALVAGLTLSAYAVTTPADGRDQGMAKTTQPQLAALRVSQPSTFSFIGVGGISLIGMLAMRRRFRTVRG
ncbi:MAG TPA: hypothetical protein VGD78_23145 [Chthoniobacterales bacterium]